MYRGKGALHPAESDRLTDKVSCVREYDVNIFFIRKNNTLTAIDAGYKNFAGFSKECQKTNVDAFRHIGTIPDWKQKGFVFDKTAPYDCFADK